MKTKKIKNQLVSRLEKPQLYPIRPNLKAKLFYCGFVSFFLILISGCQTAKKRPKTYSQGHWTAKLKLKDKATGKSYLMEVNVNAISKKKMRVDLGSIMTGPLATIVIKGNKMTLISIRKRKYFKGRASSKVIGRVISVPLHPAVLYNIFFDQKIERRGWSCKLDSNSLVKSCYKSKSQLKVTWESRLGERKVISVNHPKADLKLSIVKFEKGLEDHEELFKLVVPKSFKAITL